jgi:hypothetical protein
MSEYSKQYIHEIASKVLHHPPILVNSRSPAAFEFMMVKWGEVR